MATSSIGAPTPPPPNPRRLWPWPESPPHLLPPKPLSRRPPKHGENFGDFLSQFWRFPASGLGHRKKSVHKIRAKFFTKKSCKNPRKNPHEIIRAKHHSKNPRKKIRAKKSVQKIRAKNPCKTSVEKIRAENPCKTNLCKWFPHSSPAN